MVLVSRISLVVRRCGRTLAPFGMQNTTSRTLSYGKRFIKDINVDRNISHCAHHQTFKYATSRSFLHQIFSRAPAMNPQGTLSTRNVNFFSKLGKKKSVKGVAKRFKRLGSGALLRWRAGKNHNMRKKSRNQKRRLRKPVIVKGRQLSRLNKMISGW